MRRKLSKSAAKRARKLSRATRLKLHFVIISFIALFIILDYPVVLNWAFLALSVVCELS